MYIVNENGVRLKHIGMNNFILDVNINELGTVLWNRGMANRDMSYYIIIPPTLITSMYLALNNQQKELKDDSIEPIKLNNNILLLNNNK